MPEHGNGHGHENGRERELKPSNAHPNSSKSIQTLPKKSKQIQSHLDIGHVRQELAQSLIFSHCFGLVWIRLDEFGWAFEGFT